MNKELPKGAILGVVIVLVALLAAGYAFFVKSTGQVQPTHKFTAAELNSLYGAKPKKPGQGSPGNGGGTAATPSSKPTAASGNTASAPAKSETTSNKTSKPGEPSGNAASASTKPADTSASAAGASTKPADASASVAGASTKPADASASVAGASTKPADATNESTKPDSTKSTAVPAPSTKTQ